MVRTRGMVLFKFQGMDVKNPSGVIEGVDNKRTNANLAPFKLDLKTLDVF